MEPESVSSVLTAANTLPGCWETQLRSVREGFDTVEVSKIVQTPQGIVKILAKTHDWTTTRCSSLRAVCYLEAQFGEDGRFNEKYYDGEKVVICEKYFEVLYKSGWLKQWRPAQMVPREHQEIWDFVQEQLKIFQNRQEGEDQVRGQVDECKRTDDEKRARKALFGR